MDSLILLKFDRLVPHESPPEAAQWLKSAYLKVQDGGPVQIFNL